MKVYLGSAVKVISVSFKEMRSSGQIPASHKVHSGPSAEVHQFFNWWQKNSVRGGKDC